MAGIQLAFIVCNKQSVAIAGYEAAIALTTEMGLTMFGIHLTVAFLAGADPVPTITTKSVVVMTDEEACSTLGKIAKDTQPELPMMVDKITRMEGVAVFCSLRTFAVNKTILIDVGEFRDGWEGRKQAQWNEINCKNSAFRPLIDRGWRFTQNMTFLSGERFTLDAKCD